jgi:hypothetical protein
MADQRSRRRSAVGTVTRLQAGRSGAQIPAWTREFFSPPGALPPLSSYAFSADTEDITLVFMTDRDYGSYSISEEKVHFIKLQMTIISNNFRANRITFIY